MKEREIKIFELGASLFLILFGIYFLYEAFTAENIFGVIAGNEMAPMDVPKVILFVIVILSVMIFALTLFWFVKNKRERKERLTFFPKKTVLTFIFIIIYTSLWNVIGFTLSSFLYFSFQSKVLEPNRGWKQVILVSLGFTAACVVLFTVLFKVSFPEPLYDLIFH